MMFQKNKSCFFLRGRVGGTQRSACWEHSVGLHDARIVTRKAQNTLSSHDLQLKRHSHETRALSMTGGAASVTDQCLLVV